MDDERTRAAISTNPGKPTDEDLAAIEATSQDYVEGWFSADVERMRRCLHPDLVKRTVCRRPGDGSWLLGRPLDQAAMVGYTREGGGSDLPASEQTFEITILDVFRHIATVKVLSGPYVDYLHVARIGESWVIVNVLWEVRVGETNP
jgi:hypothetical protein